jgi:hypothetical protein
MFYDFSFTLISIAEIPTKFALDSSNLPDPTRSPIELELAIKFLNPQKTTGIKTE